MWSNNLLYMVFIIQVIFISLYMPRNIKNKINNIINEHPAELYPKLYPISTDTIRMGLSLFWGANLVICLLGFWIIAYGAYSQSEEMLNLDSSAVLMGFFLLQWIPYLTLELTSFKYLKLMRQANKVSIRTANLKARRLLDYVNLTDKILLVVSHLIFILVIEYFNRYPFDSYGGYENLLVLVFIDGFMFSIFAWNVFGKNKNPHASMEDKNNHIKNIANIMVKTISIVILFASIQLVMSATDSRYLLDLFLTLYFILISMVSFQAYGMRDVDFEVYKI